MRINLPASPRILVVVLQRLGDVLLTTPLIRSLKRTWPDACIDALVFSDTAGILSGNPDLTEIVTMPAQPSVMQGLSLAARLWNRYHLAISAQAGDRPTFFAYAAGRVRVAPVERRLSGYLKKLVLARSVPAPMRIHRVHQMLQLADAIGIVPVAEVVCPRAVPSNHRPSAPYAVIHPAPMFRYKRWTTDGWRGLARILTARGLQVVATGGPSRSERDYLDAIWGQGDADVVRCDGQLDWGQLTGLIAGAELYVGPDTSVTHLAAATGCPTIALFGPTDPVLWGPWPAEGLDTPWERRGPFQRRANIWMVQSDVGCIPCQLEGCERRLESYSRCLDQMPLDRVVFAADQALAVKANWVRSAKTGTPSL